MQHQVPRPGRAYSQQPKGCVVEHQFVAEYLLGITGRSTDWDGKEAASPTALFAQQSAEPVEPVAFDSDVSGRRQLARAELHCWWGEHLQALGLDRFNQRARMPQQGGGERLHPALLMRC